MTPEEFCLLQFDRDPALSIPTIHVHGLEDFEEALQELMHIEDCARIVIPVDLIAQRHELTATLDQTPLALEASVLLDAEHTQAGLFVARVPRSDETAYSRSDRNRIKLLELVCDLSEVSAARDRRSLENLEAENKKLQQHIERLDLEIGHRDFSASVAQEQLEATKLEARNLEGRLASLTEDLSGMLRQLQNEQNRSLAAEAEIASLKRKLEQASIRNRFRRVLGMGNSSGRARE